MFIETPNVSSKGTFLVKRFTSGASSSVFVHPSFSSYKENLTFCFKKIL